MGANLHKRMMLKPDKARLVVTKSRHPKEDGNRRERRAFRAIERKGGGQHIRERETYTSGTTTELMLKHRNMK